MEATTEKEKPHANGVAAGKPANLRERYTDAQRKKLLVEFAAAPVRAHWAKKKGLSVSMLHRWGEKLGTKLPPIGSAAAPAAKKTAAKPRRQAFPKPSTIAKKIRADMLRALRYHTEMALTYKTALEALSGIR